MVIRLQIKKIIFSAVLLLMSSSFAFADEDRHLAVDQAIGGMEQGSRISAPDAKGTAPLTDIHKTISSSQGTKKGAPSPVAAGSNHGNIYSTPAPTNNPINTITNPIDRGSRTETPAEEPSAGTGGSTPVDIGGSGETPTGIGGSETIPSETSGNPIVDVGAGVNLESGTVEADVTVDTTGELEERDIFEADLEAEGVGSIDADVGSADDLPSQEVVEETDITTDIITETVQPTQESPAAESPQESNPIVDTEVSADLESGTIEADAALDTSGELEERQIIEADVGAEETTAEAEIGSATDVTQSDIVESADITTQPVQSVIPIPADLTAEVDTTGETSGGEADVGVEADVEGISEGEDVTCDPVDGITADACGVPKL